MKKGDLVYIPSEVLLKQFDKDKESPYLSRYHKTTKPSSAVLVREGNDGCQVLFGGEIWTVEQRHLYPFEGEESGNSEANRSI